MRRPRKPMLIDESVLQRLNEEDQADYIRYVKEYNKFGGREMKTAALYFEERKGNERSPEFRQVQQILNHLNETMTHRQICKHCCGGNISPTTIGKIMVGYTKCISQERVEELLQILNETVIKKARGVI